jgi:hypothetical protein
MNLVEEVDRLNAIQPYSDWNSVIYGILRDMAYRVEEMDRKVDLISTYLIEKEVDK